MERRAFLKTSLIGLAASACGPHSLQAETAGQESPPISNKPRIVIISDIRVGKGDPDDRQSMAHLMMYANEVDILGIWPDNLDSGVEGTRIFGPQTHHL